jgi:hypothetical protein
MQRNGYTAVAKSSPVQVQPINAKSLTDLRRLSGRLEEDIRTFVIRKPAFQVPVHDGEIGTRLFQRIKIPVRPIPKPDAKPHLVKF